MLIVDRIEAGFAICELPDRSRQQIPLDLLPAGLREGDCLRESGGHYRIDRQETDRRRAAAAALFRSLQKKPDPPE